MNELLFDRLTGTISPLEFATTLTESFYSILHQRAKTGVFPANCHKNAAVNSLSLETNDYQFLLSGCADSSIKLWDLKKQETQRKENEVDSSYIKTVSEYDDFDYDNPVETFSNVATIPRKSAHQFGISGLQWWPFDTGMFVTASFDHTVKIWDTNELTPVHSFDLDNRVYSIDICGQSSPNGLTSTALVAVGSDQPFIRLLDLRSTSSSHTLTGHKGKTLVVKWHPINPNLLTSGGLDGEVKIWDIRRSKSCLCRLDMLKTNTTQAISSDNLTKASVKAHSGPVNGLVWDESGMTLYTAGNDDKVRVWDMVSTLAPPVNKLVNFGPLTRNKYPQTIPMLLNPKGETELQYLLFPSESSDVFVYRTIDGKMVSRLSRRGSKNSGRTTSMASAGPFTGTYFCGTMDGEILIWSPHWDKPSVKGFLEQAEQTEHDLDLDPLQTYKENQEQLKLLEDDKFFNANS
ncbi:WD40-repeat-containing domain protein [Scheffersomyces amazonensis]|uniref:WD40-repeat-containing domain protein n=1 Tax=Scheffersomyces amazonensis TaxID=1078765 RepID=UPI00315D1885